LAGKRAPGHGKGRRGRRSAEAAAGETKPPRRAARIRAVAQKSDVGRARTPPRPARTKVEPARKGSSRRRQAPPAERVVRVRALDPIAKCGPDTSVVELYRVDERVDGRRHWHMVFLDRHGWYCEHGRDCVAVKDARKFRAQGKDRGKR